jgi:methylenetetrahydrofolate reductase (NADPH)
MTPLAAEAIPMRDVHTADLAQALARDASLELNHLEVGDVQAARGLLRPGQRVYVSHLPKQTWAQSLQACEAVSAAGFEPVPHIPVRKVASEAELDHVLSAARLAGARELLLISGDCADADGPYSRVQQVLDSGRIQAHGFARVSVAGHPEGHPVVPQADMRQAAVDKAHWGARAGVEVAIVTQFFFEAAPFVSWARELRQLGVRARLVAGVAGPASVAKLLKLSRVCGIGASIRALTARPGSLLKLVGDRDPGSLVRDLVVEKENRPDLFDGIHLFAFGGFLRTAGWLNQMAEGHGAGSR